MQLLEATRDNILKLQTELEAAREQNARATCAALEAQAAQRKLEAEVSKLELVLKVLMGEFVPGSATALKPQSDATASSAEQQPDAASQPKVLKQAQARSIQPECPGCGSRGTLYQTSVKLGGLERPAVACSDCKMEKGVA